MTTNNDKLILARLALQDARDTVDAAFRMVLPNVVTSSDAHKQMLAQYLISASEGLTEAIENTAETIFMERRQAD